MGWAGGSDLMGYVIDATKKHVKSAATREAIYRDVIKGFKQFDCDTLHECEGEDVAFDAAMKRKRK